MQTNTNIQQAQISYWHASKYLQHTCVFVSKLSLVCDMWLFETGRNKDSLPFPIKAPGKRIMLLLLLLLLLLFTNVTLAGYLAHYILGDFLNCPLMLFLEIFHLKEILVDFFHHFIRKRIILYYTCGLSSCCVPPPQSGREQFKLGSKDKSINIIVIKYAALIIIDDHYRDY